MLRSILFPTLIACAIAFPVLYQKSTSRDLNPQLQNTNRDVDYYVASSSGSNDRSPRRGNYSRIPTDFSNPALKVTAASAPRTIIGSPAQNINTLPSTHMPQLSTSALSDNAVPLATQGTIASGPFMTTSNGGTPAIDFSQMTPDYGAVETLTFGGNAYGPDLTAGPMQFVPVNNFQEIFRFDVSPVWAKQRWERLTAIPVENGLHGLRTALVTGTNSWDLNGALTYFFDQNHRTQRITFRGWVGDPTRLVNLATQHFGLKRRPTHWAGLYVANFGGSPTGGLLMKDPETIDRRNQVQRTAVIMEINQPAGGFKLSKEFAGLMASAIPAP
jgi:hypothetical protein